jgi:hypothetical protein
MLLQVSAAFFNLEKSPKWIATTVFSFGKRPKWVATAFFNVENPQNGLQQRFSI